MAEYKQTQSCLHRRLEIIDADAELAENEPEPDVIPETPRSGFSSLLSGLRQEVGGKKRKFDKENEALHNLSDSLTNTFNELKHVLTTDSEVTDDEDFAFGRTVAFYLKQIKRKESFRNYCQSQKQLKPIKINTDKIPINL